MERIERTSVKSIHEGVRLGFDRIAHEPLPQNVEELLHVLRSREHQQAAGDRLASARG